MYHSVDLAGSCPDCAPHNEQNLGAAPAAESGTPGINPLMIAQQVANRTSSSWKNEQVSKGNKARSAIQGKSAQLTGEEKRIADGAAHYLAQYVQGIQNGSITQKTANTYWHCARVGTIPGLTDVIERRKACRLAGQAFSQGTATGLFKDTKPAPTPQSAPTNPTPVTDIWASARQPAQPTPAQPTPAQPTPAQPTPAQPTPAQPTPAQQTQPTTTQPSVVDTFNTGVQSALDIAKQMQEIYNNNWQRPTPNINNTDQLRPYPNVLAPTVNAGTPGYVLDQFTAGGTRAELSDRAQQAADANAKKILGIPAPAFYVGAGLAGLALFSMMGKKR